MRSVRSELLSAAVVLSIPVGIVFSLPFGAFGFKATEEVRCSARVAFVRLTAEAEKAALQAARASWREKVGEARRIRTELLCAELPDDIRPSVLSLRDRTRLPDPPTVRCDKTPFLPSQKALPPGLIGVQAESVPLAFPREELLKMN